MLPEGSVHNEWPELELLAPFDHGLALLPIRFLPTRVQHATEPRGLGGVAAGAERGGSTAVQLQLLRHARRHPVTHSHVTRGGADAASGGNAGDTHAAQLVPVSIYESACQ